MFAFISPTVPPVLDALFWPIISWTAVATRHEQEGGENSPHSMNVQIIRRLKMVSMASRCVSQQTMFLTPSNGLLP